ncbi:MAG: hypothetical protein ACRDPJ_05700 [Nocardioidaceae bacterium]
MQALGIQEAEREASRLYPHSFAVAKAPQVMLALGLTQPQEAAIPQQREEP